MIQEIEIEIGGNINRRDPRDKLKSGDVLERENFYVVGNDKKQNIKIPGSDRLTGNATGTSFTWLARYYSGKTAKLFGFNNGSIYHIEPLGATTQKVGSLNVFAKPKSEIMKVSSNNVMYFVDGFNGMYSHDGNVGHDWNKETSVSLNFVWIISHLDRMWGVEEDSEDLYFSKNLTPTDYTDATDAGVITIGAKRGAKIQALFLLNETLYILKEDSWFVLEGRTPETFNVREISGVPGSPCRHSAINTEQGQIIYLDQDYEFRSFNGVTSTILSYNLAFGGDFTKNLGAIINKNRVDQCVATFHNHLYRCSFCEAGETVNKMEYIFNTINLTDGFTRGNNVSSYCVWDKYPDKGELITGRSDTGLVMYQYRGLNWDNNSANPAMPYKLKSAFVSSAIRNTRFRNFWGILNVLGADDIGVISQVDTRLADSDESTTNIKSQGETKGMTNLLRINNQSSITSRGNIPWSNGRGQNISLALDGNANNMDISVTSFVVEAIIKHKKRNRHVGV